MQGETQECSVTWTSRKSRRVSIRAHVKEGWTPGGGSDLEKPIRIT